MNLLVMVGAWAFLDLIKLSSTFVFQEIGLNWVGYGFWVFRVEIKRMRKYLNQIWLNKIWFDLEVFKAWIFSLDLWREGFIF